MSLLPENPNTNISMFGLWWNDLWSTPWSQGVVGGAQVVQDAAASVGNAGLETAGNVLDAVESGGSWIWNETTQAWDWVEETASSVTSAITTPLKWAGLFVLLVIVFFGFLLWRIIEKDTIPKTAKGIGPDNVSGTVALHGIG